MQLTSALQPKHCCVRNCGCGSGPYLKCWLTRTLVFKVLSSFIVLGDGTYLGFTSLLVGCLSTNERKASCNLQSTLPLRHPLLLFKRTFPSSALTLLWSTQTVLSSVTVKPLFIVTLKLSTTYALTSTDTLAKLYQPWSLPFSYR